MRQIDYCINRIVDFKEAELQNTFVVKLGVDEDLDRCKYISCDLLTMYCVLEYEAPELTMGLHSKNLLVNIVTFL